MDIGKPLNGVTVIELGHSVAAPFAGLILADLGARVIKVENPDGGDYARGWGPPFWGETSSSFVSLNRGKEGITIDFGNGHKLVQTITGNSIHYVLDADGRAVDALPGLYNARTFIAELQGAADAVAQEGKGTSPAAYQEVK